MTVRTRQFGAFAILALTRSALACVAPVLVVLAVAGPAQAQTMSGLPNALQGFSINREKPVQITSTTLEVRDKEKRATFIGNVLVAQGDTTMKSKTLDVYYEQQEGGRPTPSRVSRVSRVSRAPAARNRSGGSKPRAGWSSPRRNRPRPATPACST